ncbi:MAG TPA: EMC3/TMCO1 family protein [Candidatus Nitrosotalea sp.]|nr:EMC3/TMCO1 family protein [Candidatus Nitrosotalea sp.]
MQWGITMEHSIIFDFLNAIALQIPGLSKGPLGSANPIVKGMIPSAFGIMSISVGLNLLNALIKRKMVDQEKLKRLLKETRAWQKERMAAFKSKDQAKTDELNKKSAYMNKMNMEVMQMNMRPMMITFLPLILVFYFVLPPLFSYTVAIAPISLNFIPGGFFELTCTAAKVAESQLPGHPDICHHVNELYFWAWYFLSSAAFSGIIMRVTKTTMDTS